MVESILNRITLNPAICDGKPTIRNMRITVETILQYLSGGDAIDEIIEMYPFLQKEAIQACMSYNRKL